MTSWNGTSFKSAANFSPATNKSIFLTTNQLDNNHVSSSFQIRKWLQLKRTRYQLCVPLCYSRLLLHVGNTFSKKKYSIFDKFAHSTYISWCRSREAVTLVAIIASAMTELNCVVNLRGSTMFTCKTRRKFRLLGIKSRSLFLPFHLPVFPAQQDGNLCPSMWSQRWKCWKKEK
jgi:hypothetical protein